MRFDRDELGLELAGAFALPAILQALGSNRGTEALRDEAQDHIPALALDGAHERAQRFVGGALRVDVERIARKAPAVGLLHQRQALTIGELDLGAQLDAPLGEAAGGALDGGAETLREDVAIVRLLVVGRHERVGVVGAAGADGVGEGAQRIGRAGRGVRRAAGRTDDHGEGQRAHDRTFTGRSKGQKNIIWIRPFELPIFLRIHPRAAAILRPYWSRSRRRRTWYAARRSP